MNPNVMPISRNRQAFRTGGLLLFLLIMARGLSWPVGLRAEHAVEDQMGRQVHVPLNPRRIVSLAPNITEILYALDLDERIAGVTEFSDFPEEAKLKPRVGTYVNSNVEKIVSLRPDLVIGTFGGTRRDTAERLESLGYPVYVTKARDMDEVMVMIEKVGTITGKSREATALANGLRKRIKAVVDRVAGAPRPLVFLEINGEPLMTVGAASFHHELISLAGGENLAAHTNARYPQYSVEDVVRRAPDCIIISTMDRGGLFEEQKAEWMRWPHIPAVKNNRICFIDSDLIDRPSPRIVEGLEAMARLIHPELY
jgi:iron complex transport system substrate-binding protein